jgi:hypothetical protein
MILLYIDPGSGNVIVQLIIAGVASTLAYSKQLRTVIFGFMKGIFKKKHNN